MGECEYLLPSDLNKLFNAKVTSPFSLFHMNAQPIRNKFDQLDILFDSCGFLFDVIMLTETWYSSNEEVALFENYANFSLHRTSSRGGEVCAYARSSMKCTVVAEITAITNDYEILTLNMNKTIFFCNSPSTSG